MCLLWYDNKVYQEKLLQEHFELEYFYSHLRLTLRLHYSLSQRKKVHHYKRKSLVIVI